MPSYSWICPSKHHWIIFSSVSGRDNPQACPECNASGTRAMWMDAGYIDKDSAGSWNKGEMNPGLGCVTKGIKDAEKIARSRGLEPIGTESPESLHKAAEKRQAQIREDRWNEASRDKLYE